MSGATSWDIDEVSEEELSNLRQYTPSEEELREMEKSRKGKTVRLKDLLNDVADFAEDISREPTEFSKITNEVMRNPLRGDTPYITDNASFVYWCFEANGVDISFEGIKPTIMDFKTSGKIVDIYSYGSDVKLDNLLRGDILFLNEDRHIAIYLGESKFVSMNGPSNRASTGGVYINSLEDPYWNKMFQGHVMRFIG